ncbi:hypothetical protein F4808DRAFT_242237 [Astrocystis sublimbata]|nr:hypothetical protein F4808DRAFT_242237 [Astrocystis sublimbata]
MSWWSHIKSGAAGQSTPPPLPPRVNNGGRPIGAPPPLPPRPASFGHQPVQDNPDISHYFPDGNIPPPPPAPPRQEAASTTQSEPPSYDEYLKLYPADSPQQQSNNEQPSSPQAAPVLNTANPGKHTGTTQNDALHSSTQHVGNTSPEEAGSTQSQPAIHHQPTVTDDVEPISQTFQSMGLSTHGDVPSDNSQGGSQSKYQAYSPPPPPPPPSAQPSNAAPAIPAKIPHATRYTGSPGPRPQATGAANVPETASRQPQAVPRECISADLTFGTTWYTHPRAPEYLICMNCYENHIRNSQFRNAFQGTFMSDGKPRGCGFTGPRVKDHLWNLALASASLDDLIAYMKLRPSIPSCRGLAGVQAGSGIKWYRTRNNDIPAMAVCQACYEDHILAYPQFGHSHFEPVDATTIERVANQTWSCDIATPYINQEYKLRASTNDWQAFVQGVNTRLMALQSCPGAKDIYPEGKGRVWFNPINYPEGLLICGACYCDYVVSNRQEEHWRDAGENTARRFGVSVTCFFGAQINLQIMAGRVLQTNDYALFWKAFATAAREPRCNGRMQNATWYTLHSNPNEFEICQTCYVTMAESMGIGHHFKPKDGIPPDSSIICSFNPGIARFPVYMAKLLEMVYKQDPHPLEEFVKEYAHIPLCRRDTHIENARWFGWNECTICVECHHEFVRGTALADSMPHQGTQVRQGVMCDMYSPRMRQLYLAACASNPPDPKELLEYSVHRSTVWAQTMPQAKKILSEMKMKMYQQQMATNNSMFYTWSGNLMQNTLPLETTYTTSAIGSGHYNHMQIKGAEYGRQASAIGAEIRGAPAYVADELEKRWRLVE